LHTLAAPLRQFSRVDYTSEEFDVLRSREKAVEKILHVTAAQINIHAPLPAPNDLSGGWRRSKES
jgi:hypothetical protein